MFKFNKDSIERVQRRATKMVPSIKHLPYSERLKELDLETLSYRRTRADLLEIYRITSGLHAIDQDCKCSICPEKTMLQPSLSSATRGHSKKLQIQTATGVRKHFFSDRSAPTWNKLSEATISSPNINLFKSNLRKDLGHQRFEYKS